MTRSTYRQSKPHLPTEEEASVARSSYAKLVSLQNHQPYCTLEVQGKEITIPAAVLDLLVDILALMGQGNAVELNSIPKELDLYQAADIFGISRLYLVGLLEEGKIPYWIDETVYRIDYEDLIKYKNISDREQSQIMDELVAESEAIGLYKL